MSSWAAKQNIGLDLSGKIAVVSGGTQGIGAGVGLRFAMAGASVYILGRDTKRGEEVVQAMKQVAPSPGPGKQAPTFEFIKADLSLGSGMKEAASNIQKKTSSHGGVDYLIQTQGGPPNGSFSLTADHIESHFAVQCLSRFALPYLLAESGLLKSTVISICAPSGTKGKAPSDIIEDLDLQKVKESGGYGILKCGGRDSAVVDGFTAHFQSKYSHVTFIHTFPGIVHTSAVSNSGFPYPVVLAAQIFLPILARTPFGNSPRTYSEIPLYLATGGKMGDNIAEKNLEFCNQRLKSVGAPNWTKEDVQLREKLARNLTQMLEGGQKS